MIVVSALTSYIHDDDPCPSYLCVFVGVSDQENEHTYILTYTNTHAVLFFFVFVDNKIRTLEKIAFFSFQFKIKSVFKRERARQRE